MAPKDFEYWLVAPEFDAVAGETFGEARREGCRDVLMDQHALGRVAGRGVLVLAVATMSRALSRSAALST